MFPRNSLLETERVPTVVGTACEATHRLTSQGGVNKAAREQGLALFRCRGEHYVHLCTKIHLYIYTYTHIHISLYHPIAAFPAKMMDGDADVQHVEISLFDLPKRSGVCCWLKRVQKDLQAFCGFVMCRGRDSKNVSTA